jgi:hypothetical protein
MKILSVALLTLSFLLFCLSSCNDYGTKTTNEAGDINGDKHLTVLDLDTLKSWISEGLLHEEGDLNDDGVLDNQDIEILAGWICEANGASINDAGDCCFDADADGTICCDTNFDGDFESCNSTTICQDDSQCNMANCQEAYCIDGQCLCAGSCMTDEHCQMLNCPAYCNEHNQCECKVTCEQDMDCAFISKCPSVCDEEQGMCVCDEFCTQAGEMYIPDSSGQHNCCPGLEPLTCADYVNGECLWVDCDCECYICAACGNGVCEAGENPCNCPADCSDECAPGDSMEYTCDSPNAYWDLNRPWCICTSDGTWDCVQSPEDHCIKLPCETGETLPCDCAVNNMTEAPTCSVCDENGTWLEVPHPEMGACHCVNWPYCAEGFVCEPEGGMCVTDCRSVDCSDPNEVCDEDTGLCHAPTECLEDGEEFSGYPEEGNCCPGLVPISIGEIDSNGNCAYPNCLCYMCSACGDGICSSHENRCNCPSDCVGSSECTADICSEVAQDYFVGPTDCIGISDNPIDYTIPVYQEGCSLSFDGSITDVLGSSACIDGKIIFTESGCTGTVSEAGYSRTIHFSCPSYDAAGNLITCSFLLDDLIDG